MLKSICRYAMTRLHKINDIRNQFNAICYRETGSYVGDISYGHPGSQETTLASIRQRMQHKVLMLTFKAHNSLAPDYLMELLVEYQPVRSLISSQHCSLVVPITRQQLHGDWAFSTVAPRLWDDLSVEIKTATSLGHFKSNIKTYLFCQTFPEQSCLCNRH